MRECIILAGGLGTRLRSVINDKPKCLAIVNGLPFLDYVLQILIKYNFEHFIFSLGYKSDDIISYINASNPNLNKTIVIEEKPLGTGGATKLALQYSKTQNVLIINADTYFNFNINLLYNFHDLNNSYCTIALKYMYNFDRYGSVVVDDLNRIILFEEKKKMIEGFINSGFILLNKNIFNKINSETFFLIEDLYIELILNLKIYGFKTDGYFIDIGIPDDFDKANLDFKELSSIDNE